MEKAKNMTPPSENVALAMAMAGEAVGETRLVGWAPNARTAAGLDMHCTFFQQSDTMMEMLRDIPCIDSVTGFHTIKPGTVNLREVVWEFKNFRRLERDSEAFKAFVTVAKMHYFEVFDDEENSWVYEFSDDGDASHVLTIGLFMNWR